DRGRGCGQETTVLLDTERDEFGIGLRVHGRVASERRLEEGPVSEVDRPHVPLGGVAAGAVPHQLAPIATAVGGAGRVTAGSAAGAVVVQVLRPEIGLERLARPGLV